MNDWGGPIGLDFARGQPGARQAAPRLEALIRGLGDLSASMGMRLGHELACCAAGIDGPSAPPGGPSATVQSRDQPTPTWLQQACRIARHLGHP